MDIILNQLKKKAVILCPLCNKEFKPTDIKVVQDAHDTILAHSNCPKCHIGIISLLHKDTMGITLIGMATDLNYKDIIKMKNNKTIVDNDVLEIFSKIN